MPETHMADSVLTSGSILLLDVLKEQSAHLFQNPAQIITCTSLREVPACLQQLEEAQRNGLWAAGYLAYELGYAFEPKLKERWQESGEPLLWFGIYDAPQDLSIEQARSVLETAAGGGFSCISQPVFDMDRDRYDAAFDKAQDHLAKGDIYQVNLTMRARFDHEGAPEHLFLDLLRKQPVEFAALLKLEDRSVLSLSPELFLERKGNCLRTKPMKGTAPRGRFASEDARIARELASDPKQRSENIMIVDLMRNDLSRIAETGTVKVDSLCEVERYQSLHQMTSTVTAQLPDPTSFKSIIENLFPCGSITGAPKLSAMQIAHDLETGPRGIYTGSIGFLKPDGDFCFNVAIRTIELSSKGEGVAGAGSGVVFDSGAAPEYDECRLKLKFLTEATPEFELIETMAFEPLAGFLLLERHLQRLQKSAEYFGFRWNESGIRKALAGHCDQVSVPRRVRLLLGATGAISVTSTEITPVDNKTIFNIVLAEERTNSCDPFLFHKTTNRSFYDETRVRYQAETGCQEIIFINENGFLTEGSYMSLFLKMGGKLLTPALSNGLLPGTLREGLLEHGLAFEADLTEKDLYRAEEVFVGNSVRGLVRARLSHRLEAAPDFENTANLDLAYNA